MNFLRPISRSIFSHTLALVLLSLPLAQSFAAGSGQQCGAALSSSTTSNSNSTTNATLRASRALSFQTWRKQTYQEAFDLPARITDSSGIELAHSIKSATDRPEIRQLIQNNKSSMYKILLNAQLPAKQGGGRLRLVVLNLSEGNLAYNHVELVSLLNVNPQMANELGFYRVPDIEYAVWVPDVVTMKHRLTQFSKAQGFGEPVFSYEPATGVIGTQEYVELLSRGKFPFSNDSDVNLSVHDSLHSVAFAMMNSTPNSRKILKAAQSRNQTVIKILERIQTEVPSSAGQSFAKKFLEKSKWISSDSLERTMLLTILMTGNYDYFSAHHTRITGNFSAPQNREITRKRVQKLVEYYNYGTQTFGKILGEILPESVDSGTSHWVASLFSSLTAAERAQIRTIFSAEVAKMKTASQREIEKSSHELMSYFSQQIYSDSADSTASAVSSRDSTLRSAGPETLGLN